MIFWLLSDDHLPSSRAFSRLLSPSPTVVPSLSRQERHTLLERLHADGLSISRPTLIAFLLVLEAEYGDNTYHNRKHGADVLLGMHRFLTETADGDSRPPSHTASFTGAQSAAADAPADAPATPVGAFTSPPASDTSRDDDRCWPLSALQVIAADCLGLLPIASDCCRWPRIASDCCRWLRIAADGLAWRARVEGRSEIAGEIASEYHLIAL